MALTFATHTVAGPWWAQRLVAVAGVLGLTALNYRGVTKTAIAARILVGATLAVLVVVVAGTAVAGGLRVGNLGSLVTNSHGGLYGTLQSAGLLFFAFAGYARIATMGEEVRDPERTINAVADDTIEIADKKGNQARLQIDANGLPQKVTYQLAAMQGKAASIENAYSDIKEVEGIKLPFKIIISQNGRKAAEMTVQEYKLNQGLKPADIDKRP